MIPVFIKHITINNFINISGDIGGYMGLLLGASVMTVFEFVDFIFYNIAAKLYKKQSVGSA